MEPMKVTTMNVSLPSELARFVRAKVESGHYSSVSEVIREALRLLAGSEKATRDEGVSGPTRTLSGARYDRRKAVEAMQGIRELARQTTLGGLSLEDLPHEG